MSSVAQIEATPGVELFDEFSPKTGGVNDSLRGATYQIKIVMLFAYKGSKHCKTFKIESEVEEAATFDDLVFYCEPENNQNTWIFGQAKHSKNKKSITFENFLNSKDYKLDKYFEAFIKIKSQFSFTIAMYIFTNNELDIIDCGPSKPNLYQFREHCDIFFQKCEYNEIFGPLGERFKIVGRDPKLRNERSQSMKKLLKLVEKTLAKTGSKHSDVENFLDRLIFVTNLNESDIDNILRKEISENLNMENIDGIFNDHVSQFIKYVKNNQTIDLNNIKNFYIKWRQEIYTHSLIGLKSDYINKYMDSKIEFAKVESEIENFLDPSFEKRVLIILTSPEEEKFAVVKVYQAIKARDMFKKKDSYLALKTSISKKYFNAAVVTFLNESSFKLFVIECDSHLKNYYANEDALFDFISKNSDKKLIVIACKDKFEIVDSKTKDSIFEVNLRFIFEMEPQTALNVTESYLEELLTKEICFQGNTVQLQCILDKRSEFLKTLTLKGLENIKEVAKNIPAYGTIDQDLFVERDLLREEPDEMTDSDQKTSRIAQFKMDEIILRNEKIILFSDIAGNGKSELENYLAKKTKESNVNKWVVKIDLNEYTKELSQEVDEKTLNLNNESTAIEFLADKIFKINNAIEKGIFIDALKNPNRFICFFDGFDEVSRYYKEEAFTLIKLLEKTQIEKIYISTRRELEGELEEKLQVKSYQISSLSKENQKKFLIKYFTKYKNETKMTKVTNLDDYVGKKLIEIEEKIHNFQQLSSTPLITRMLAEIFEDINESDMDLYKIYEKFIEKRYKKFFEKGNTDDTKENVIIMQKIVRDNLQKNHENLALNELFNHNELIKYGIGEKFDSSKLSDLLKCGIIVEFNKTYKFSHKTYTEHYFVSKCLKNIRESKFADFLIDSIFIKSEYKMIRLFFNKKLTQDDVMELYGKKILTNSNLNGNKNYILNVCVEEEVIENFTFFLKSLLKKLKKQNENEQNDMMKKFLNVEYIKLWIIKIEKFEFIFDLIIKNIKMENFITILKQLIRTDLETDDFFNNYNSKYLRLLNWIDDNGFKDFIIQHVIEKDKENVTSRLYYFAENNKWNVFWNYTKELSWIMNRNYGLELIVDIVEYKKYGTNILYCLKKENIETIENVLTWLKSILTNKKLEDMLIATNINGSILHHFEYNNVSITCLLTWIKHNLKLEENKSILEKLLNIKSSTESTFFFTLYSCKGNFFKPIIESFKRDLNLDGKFLEKLICSKNSDENSFIHDILKNKKNVINMKIIKEILDTLVTAYTKDLVTKLILLEDGFQYTFLFYINYDPDEHEFLHLKDFLDWLVSFFGHDPQTLYKIFNDKTEMKIFILKSANIRQKNEELLKGFFEVIKKKYEIFKQSCLSSEVEFQGYKMKWDNIVDRKEEQFIDALPLREIYETKCIGKNTVVYERFDEKKHIERRLLISKREFSVDDFINSKETTLLLVDKFRSGKSEFFNYVAKKLKKEYKSKWIFMINLRDYVGDIEKHLKNKRINSEDIEYIKTFIVEVLLNVRCRLERQILEHDFEKPNKIILFFDNFDSVPASYQKDFLSLFKYLEKTKVERIFISSRTKINFEAKLGLQSYSFKEMKKIEIPKEHKLYKWLNYLKDFTLSPLTYFVTNKFIENATNSTTLFEIYESCINSTLDSFFDQKIDGNEMTKLKSTLEHLALKEYLNSEYLQSLGSLINPELESDQILKATDCGVIKADTHQFENQNDKHYFVTLFFLNCKKSNVANFMINFVFIADDFKVIRLLLNGKLNTCMELKDTIRKINILNIHPILELSAKENLFDNFDFFYDNIVKNQTSSVDLLEFWLHNSNNLTNILNHILGKIGLQEIENSIKQLFIIEFKSANRVGNESKKNSKNCIEFLEWLKSHVSGNFMESEVFGLNNDYRSQLLFNYAKNKQWHNFEVMKEELDWIKNKYTKKYVKKIICWNENSTNLLSFCGDHDSLIEKIYKWLFKILGKDDLTSMILPQNGTSPIHQYRKVSPLIKTLEFVKSDLNFNNKQLLKLLQTGNDKEPTVFFVLRSGESSSYSSLLKYLLSHCNNKTEIANIIIKTNKDYQTFLHYLIVNKFGSLEHILEILKIIQGNCEPKLSEKLLTAMDKDSKSFLHYLSYTLQEIIWLEEFLRWVQDVFKSDVEIIYDLLYSKLGSNITLDHMIKTNTASNKNFSDFYSKFTIHLDNEKRTLMESLGNKVIRFQNRHAYWKKIIGENNILLRNKLPLKILKEETSLGDKIPLTVEYEKVLFIEMTLKKNNQELKSSSLTGNNELTIISGGIGSGKSELLNSLAEKIKDDFPHKWVVRINLNEFENDLENERNALVDKPSAVKFVTEKMLEFTNANEKLIFEYSLNDTDKIVLLMDGYSQLSEKSRKVAKNFIHSLKDVKNIYITTEPETANELTNKFNVTPYEICPFSEIDKKMFFDAYYTENASFLTTLKDFFFISKKSFVDQKIKMNENYNKNNSEKELFNRPLIVKMIVETDSNVDGNKDLFAVFENYIDTVLKKNKGDLKELYKNYQLMAFTNKSEIIKTRDGKLIRKTRNGSEFKNILLKKFFEAQYYLSNLTDETTINIIFEKIGTSQQDYVKTFLNIKMEREAKGNEKVDQLIQRIYESDPHKIMEVFKKCIEQNLEGIFLFLYRSVVGSYKKSRQESATILLLKNNFHYWIKNISEIELLLEPIKIQFNNKENDAEYLFMEICSDQYFLKNLYAEYPERYDMFLKWLAKNKFLSHKIINAIVDPIIFFELQKNCKSIKISNYIKVLDLIKSTENAKEILCNILINESKKNLLHIFNINDLSPILMWIKNFLDTKDVEKLFTPKLFIGPDRHSNEKDFIIFIIEWMKENQFNLLKMENIIFEKDRNNRSFLFNDKIRSASSYIRILGILIDYVNLEKLLDNLLCLQEEKKHKSFLHCFSEKESAEDVMDFLKWLCQNLDSQQTLKILLLKDNYDQTFLYYQSFDTISTGFLSDMMQFFIKDIKLEKNDFVQIFLSPNKTGQLLKDKIYETTDQASKESFNIFCQHFVSENKNINNNYNEDTSTINEDQSDQTNEQHETVVHEASSQQCESRDNNNQPVQRNDHHPLQPNGMKNEVDISGNENILVLKSYETGH